LNDRPGSSHQSLAWRCAARCGVAIRLALVTSGDGMIGHIDIERRPVRRLRLPPRQDCLAIASRASSSRRHRRGRLRRAARRQPKPPIQPTHARRFSISWFRMLAKTTPRSRARPAARGTWPGYFTRFVATVVRRRNRCDRGSIHRFTRHTCKRRRLQSAGGSCGRVKMSGLNRQEQSRSQAITGGLTLCSCFHNAAQFSSDSFGDVSQPAENRAALYVEKVFAGQTHRS